MSCRCRGCRAIIGLGNIKGMSTFMRVQIKQVMTCITLVHLQDTMQRGVHVQKSDTVWYGRGGVASPGGQRDSSLPFSAPPFINPKIRHKEKSIGVQHPCWLAIYNIFGTLGAAWTTQTNIYIVRLFPIDECMLTLMPYT